jgi:hypothetical protein
MPNLKRYYNILYSEFKHNILALVSKANKVKEIKRTGHLGANDEFKAVNIKLNKVETLKPCCVLLRNEFCSIMPQKKKKKKKKKRKKQPKKKILRIKI